ncbi:MULTISPECIES: orotate phosphoribosyltransferase [unclassified Devosia]|uniref:orotate phosphoribosyltransferase n=1 Tax=unclassified Devosia TaxID=196773 RepID=UPI00145CCF54|nr:MULTISPECIES: orotate phosphoribosyltransferase [unclassified Devosia]MBJ6986809.1 orotate phosphoribosyltransferase [Devosia sp. MC521]MBK1795644.1 orotate phosphoribosyltransferase [Devosia sp. WQ 349K1]QMW63844.1 orotate phosphoribosyltransferase [Devosia sp. MC521]
MNRDEVLDIFRECGAMLEGHFILSSGLRSPVFLQKAKVFQYAHQTEKLCKALAERIKAEVPGVTKVVSPAIGGIIPGYETSRHLNLPALYTERVDGKFELRRGFEISPDDKVIVVEDIVSTGLSIRECVEALRGIGANVVAAACLIDRSGGEADVGVPLISLIEFKVPAYPADNLPPELAAIPAVKPGSRGIQGVK